MRVWLVSFWVCCSILSTLQPGGHPATCFAIRITIFSVLQSPSAMFVFLSVLLRLDFFSLAIYFYTHLPQPCPISLKSGRIFPLTSATLESGQESSLCCAVVCFLLTIGRQSWRTNLPQPAPESFDSWMCWRRRKLCRGKMWVYIFPVNHWTWCVFPFLISRHGSRKRTE